MPPIVVFGLLIVIAGFLGANWLFHALPPSRPQLVSIGGAVLFLWVYGEVLGRRNAKAGERFIFGIFVPLGLLIFGVFGGVFWRWWR